MKHKSILSLLIFLMGLGMTTTSCEDMLTPDMTRYAENFTGRDTVYFYLGILRNVQDMVEQNELLGDLRSDLVNTTSYSSDSVSNIINYSGQHIDGENGLLNRAAYYKVINQCNFYLAKVDTTAQKNQIKYMKREYAQVLNIRAWTYLQLVQTYGNVPFITKPVDNADTGWEKNPEQWANADNLLDLLKGDLKTANAIEYAKSYGYPDYGEFATGNSNFKVKSEKLRFYSDLILGDLYLLHSQSRQDYVEAAKCYYKFLNRTQSSTYNVGGNFASFSRSQLPTGAYRYNASISSWVGSGLAATSLGNENLTIIPSAANSTFGKVLTRSAQIYGFDPSSSNTTSSDVNGGSVSTSGQVSVSVNYRSRQVAPSNAYVNLCKSQSYQQSTISGSTATNVTYYTGAGDARLWATAPIIVTKEGGSNEENNRYIVKSVPVTEVGTGCIAGTGAFKHYRSIYRVRQVWLRYAEAINRAGYPRMAFAVLRDGLNKDLLPSLADSVKYDDAAEKKTTVEYLDSASVTNKARAIYYLGNDELRRIKHDPEYNAYLNFWTDSYWTNRGIHEQGCGGSSVLDSIYSYKNMVLSDTGRIAKEAARVGALTQSLKRHLRALRAAEDGVTDGDGDTGDTPEEPSLDEKRENYEEVAQEDPQAADPMEILAVETLIADECALETAYEGTRMFDLIRFARHMNQGTSSDYGTQWLAWKIAGRNEPLAPYQEPGQYDHSLYNKLLVPNNWYIVNPVY